MNQQKGFKKLLDTTRFNREFATFKDGVFVDAFFEELVCLGMNKFI